MEAASEPPRWRANLERNALWWSLGAIGAAILVVAIGVQVAPETFYDRFVWEDLYGPLVVDAHQCPTAAACPGLEGPRGIAVKDGYTVTSELTYGAILAVLLYGIFVGLFRRFGVVADGRFVLALIPWILLGPLMRVLEDANVFCKFQTACEPGVFAYFFISPVIYLHIAAYVIPAILLGVYLQRRADVADKRLLTGTIAAVYGAGLFVYAAIGTLYAEGFTTLVPLWFVALTMLAGLGIFHRRAVAGQATVNLTVFVLGLPYAFGGLFLVGRWLQGDVWSSAAWSGAFHLDAGAFILASALGVALATYLLARALVRAGVEARLAALAAKVDATRTRALGWFALVTLLLGLALTGILFPLTDLVHQLLPASTTLTPYVMTLGLLATLAYILLHVGREAAQRPRVLLIYAGALNLALVVGHMIDGLSTWVALSDPLEMGIPPYSEKHPFSDFLLRYWDGFLFPVAKLLMVVVIVWLLDREGAKPVEPGKTLHDEQNLIGLVKMAIFTLGFAPGVRDLLRLTMGV